MPADYYLAFEGPNRQAPPLSEGPSADRMDEIPSSHWSATPPAPPVPAYRRMERPSPPAPPPFIDQDDMRERIAETSHRLREKFTLISASVPGTDDAEQRLEHLLSEDEEVGPSRVDGHSGHAHRPGQPGPPAGGGRSRWPAEAAVWEATRAHLEAAGFALSRSQTDARAHPDLAATQGHELLWVALRGYPPSQVPTSPAELARQWFGSALLQLVSLRTARPEVTLALALPDEETYRTLAAQTKWLRTSLPLTYLWIDQEGAVREAGEAPPARVNPTSGVRPVPPSAAKGPAPARPPSATPGAETDPSSVAEAKPPLSPRNSPEQRAARPPSRPARGAGGRVPRPR